MTGQATASAQNTSTANAQQTQATGAQQNQQTGGQQKPNLIDGAQGGGEGQQQQQTQQTQQTQQQQTQEGTVPEKYSLRLPKDSVLKDAHIEKIAAYAKERGFSNEQAQELLNRESDAVSEYATEQKTTLETNRSNWLKQLQNDPDVGGDKLSQNGELAFEAANRFFGKDFVEEIRKSGLNHHPLLFKGLVKLGQAMQSDSFVRGGVDNSNRGKTIADRLYGKKNK